MIKLEKWTGTKSYMYPSGELASPERIKNDFSAIDTFTHVIQTDHRGQVCFAVMNLGALEDQYNIVEELTDDESIAQIEVIMNTQPIIDTSPTAEERIASAMEYQNLLL